MTMHTRPLTVALPSAVPALTGATHFLNGSALAQLPANVPLSFQNQQPWTLELWFSADALIDNMNLLGKANEFMLCTKNGGLYAALQGQTTPLQSPAALADDTFYYVAVVYDGLNMSLYLNGALLVQTTTNASPAATGNPLTIGGGFYGQVQGLRVWNVAINSLVLSDNQWNDFAAGTAGLLAQIDFTVSPPADSSGQGVTPSFAGGISYLSLAPAAVLTVNSFCDPYNDQSVNPGGSNTPFSVTAWICPTLLGEEMFIFTNGVAESNSGMTLLIDSNGKLVFQIGSAVPLVSNTTLQPGTWYYVAATWANNTGTLYINGTQDASAGNLSLAGSQAQGEPLIGAIASVGAELPISSFQGLIQSVAVWNTALTAAEVTQYMDVANNNPQAGANCVADYELGIQPAQNTSSLNPVGLVAGASLDSIPVQPPVGAVGGALRALPFKPQPRVVSHAAVPSGVLAVTLGSPAHLQQALQEYEAFLATLPLSAQQRDAFSAHFKAKISSGQQDFLQGQLKNHLNCRIDSLPGGINRLVHLRDDGEHVVYEGTLSPCVLWCIQMIAAIVGALFTAFGFVLNWTKFLNGFTTFLGTRINSIDLMPQLVALFNAGSSANNIYKALKLLHEYSLLVPLARLSWGLLSSSVSWWTVISVGARILLIVSPAAPLEVAWLVAQLAYSVYSIAQLLAQRPANCP